MKLIELLTEMAKGKNKRKRSAKLARKKKAETPTLDDQSNPVAKFAQQSGAGAHETKGKRSTGKRQRKEGKKEIKQDME